MKIKKDKRKYSNDYQYMSRINLMLENKIYINNDYDLFLCDIIQ